MNDTQVAITTEYANYAAVPWYRRSGTNTAFVLVHLLSCGTMPFLLATCIILLTGDIYFNQQMPNGGLRKWGVANKVIAFLIVGLTVLVMASVFISLVTGWAQRRSKSPSEFNLQSAETSLIDRDTFSFSLPRGWSEDTATENYDPNRCTSFENNDSCIIFLLIGDKTTGITVDELLSSQIDYYKEKMSNETIRQFTKWAGYDVEGYELTGKIYGFYTIRVRIIGIESAENAYLVLESADLEDRRVYAEDLLNIEQSFKVKP